MYSINQTARSLKSLLFTHSGSRFRQNFLKVAKANVLAQALSLFVAPLLTRLYSPSDFGTVTVFSSLLSIMLSFSTWRFDWSVPNATSRTQSVALLVLGFIALLFFSISSFIVLWFFSPSGSFWKGFQVVGPFLILLPIALMGGGLHQLMQAWYIRETNLTAVSKTKIAQSVVGTGMNLAGGIASLGSFGLIISSVVSAWVGIGLLLKHAVGLRSSSAKISFRRVRQALFKFGWESSLSTSVAIVNTTGLSAVPLLFAHYYSTTEIGWYALAQRIAIAPTGLITSAIGQSFWAEAASLVKTDRLLLRKLYLQTSKRLALVAIPIVIICLSGPLIVRPVFGEQWQNAGYVLAALGPLLFGQIVVSPLSHLIVHRKQHWQLLWDVCRVIFLLITIIVCTSRQESLTYTVFWTSIVMFGMYLFLFCLNLKNLRSRKF